MSMTPAGVREDVADRAVHLRRAAQAVRVLHGVVALAVARDQRAARQQPAQVGGAGQLAGVRPDHLHPLVVRACRCPSSASTLIAAAMSATLTSSPISSIDQREQHLHRLGAVDQADRPSFGGEHQRLDALLGQQLGRRPAPQVGVAPPAQPALADQRLGQVRELGQVAGRADRALAGDDRQQVVVEQLQQLGGQLGPDAGVAARSGSGPAAAAGRGPTSSGSGSPTPALCERIRASCICSRSSRPTWVSASAPKPVVMPYITLSCSTASATTARLGAIRAATPSPSTAPASPRATATRSSRARASPVTVTVRMAGNLVGLPGSGTTEGRLRGRARFGRGPGRSAMVSSSTTGGREAARSSRGRGSVGRASPCQGEGRGFESRRPLGGDSRLIGLTRWSGREARQRPAKPSTRVQIPSPPRVQHDSIGRLAQSG